MKIRVRKKLFIFPVLVDNAKITEIKLLYPVKKFQSHSPFIDFNKRIKNQKGL
jgi:hypothetical protein